MPPLGPVYVCLHRGTSVVSRLIRWQNRSDYSHASLMLPMGQHIESREGKGVLWHPKFTLANQLPAGTAANDLNIVVDPDTANYTGSITVTVEYQIVGGTP